MAILLTLLAIASATAQRLGVIQGTVSDTSGASIFGAVVSVQSPDGNRHTTATAQDGSFVISSLPPGNYSVTISADGLSDWAANDVPSTGSSFLVAVLNVAPSVTSVTVGLSPQEVATEQLKRAETQRTFAVIPNFFVTYDRHPAPLSAKQKLQLGFRTVTDPAIFGAALVTAGIEQGQNSYRQFGQGAEGYAKRFGAQYGTAVDGIFLGGVVMDSIFHQDPRYFYSGRGTRLDRLRYALKASFLVKGDNGRWQFPYGDLTGTFAAAEVTQAYLPDPRSQESLLLRSLAFHYAGRLALSLGEEFLLKKFTSHAPADKLAKNVPTLTEGTPVSLIAVDGLTTEGAIPGQRVSFVLAQDLTAEGKVFASTGTVASGQVGRVGTAKLGGTSSSIELVNISLRAGASDIPLRSNQARGITGPMQCKELADSHKIVVTLYVAANVRVPESE
ncbi:MAG TPA: carboxypeptidase-like regulatory domain-containing protein [Bryobacteraceae bacterium]|nr:carboxypeptidase-like regulatory domain-containing protein [Bryobacteraceae bacterium]